MNNGSNHETSIGHSHFTGDDPSHVWAKQVHSHSVPSARLPDAPQEIQAQNMLQFLVHLCAPAETRGTMSRRRK